VPDPSALDGNAQMMLLGMVGSVVVALLVQPLLLTAVRPVVAGRRPD